MGPLKDEEGRMTISERNQPVACRLETHLRVVGQSFSLAKSASDVVLLLDQRGRHQ